MAAVELLTADHIDLATFEQILELDDGDSLNDSAFSRSLVSGFLDQARTTFDEIEEGLQKEDLAKLSSLGHFLKGSSATLGLHKIRDSCEKIQNLGSGKDEKGARDLGDPKLALSIIKATLVDMKKEFQQVTEILRKFYQADKL